MAGLIADIVNVAQVGLTVTFILFCWLLLKTWRRGFFDAFHFPVSTWKPEDWLVVGIVIGFAGNLLDNAFWGIHWLLDLYRHPLQPAVMDLGPLANVVFREIPGIVAVFCHLKAAVGLADAQYSLNRKTLLYSLAGVSAILVVSATLFL